MCFLVIPCRMWRWWRQMVWHGFTWRLVDNPSGGNWDQVGKLINFQHLPKVGKKCEGIACWPEASIKASRIVLKNWVKGAFSGNTRVSWSKSRFSTIFPWKQPKWNCWIPPMFPLKMGLMLFSTGGGARWEWDGASIPAGAMPSGGSYNGGVGWMEQIFLSPQKMGDTLLWKVDHFPRETHGIFRIFLSVYHFHVENSWMVCLSRDPFPECVECSFGKL